jgi:Fe(3+) dicitrate transport protein
MRVPPRSPVVRALCLAALFGATPLAAQVTIRGEVRDQASAPIHGADVSVTGTEARVLTDTRGRFRLEIPEPGAHQVEVGRVGYERQTRTLEINAPEGSAVANFVLAEQAVDIPEITVIGSKRAALQRIPGSAELVTQETLLRTAPIAADEVFRKIPGVNVQSEEGMGMRANIGIRGLSPDRSRTVLMLEDGVPIALNPYGEPEMYYTPPIERMERIEVVKGSGSIVFGPRTIGGVVNYVTPNPPLAPIARADVQAGAGGFARVLASYGGTWGNVGSYTSFLHRRADDLNGLNLRIADFTSKLAFDTGERSRLGAKVGIYDETSNSTYVGLTEAMFAENPHQHPAPDDLLHVRRLAASATHDLALGHGVTLRTTAFGNTTFRNWSRQNYSRTDGGTTLTFVSSTGNRDRSFEVMGLEPRVQWNHAALGIRNETDAGVRVLREKAFDGFTTGTTATARSGTLRDYEVRTGTAYSAFLQNRFFLRGEQLQVVPGVRFESFDYERHIQVARVERIDPSSGARTFLPENVDVRSGDDVTAVIPGIGLVWNPSERLTLFGGAHRGFAPPRVKDAMVVSQQPVAPGEAPVAEVVSLQLDAERSVNSELGIRSRPLDGVTVEATGFVLNFSNEIIAPSLSAGSAAGAALANQGETRHRGFESSLSVDVGVLAGWPLSVVADARSTLLRSKFGADRFMVAPSGDTVNVNGNRLPYSPEGTWTLGLAVEHPRGAGLRLDGTRVGEQYSDNFMTVDPDATGRRGLIPSYTVWNVGASYPVAGATLFGTVKNLFDETYVASRRPDGIKAGLPRMLQVGVRTRF